MTTAANPMTNDNAPSGRKKITDSYLVVMLGRFLMPHWRAIAVVFALMVVVTLLTLSLPLLVQRAVDGPIADGDLNALVPYGVVYFIVVVAIFGIRFAHTYLLQTVGQTALLNLRQTLYTHILSQDMRYFTKTPVGQIVSRLSNDIEALTELVSTSFVMVVSNMVTLVGIIVAMLALNWRLALISLVVLPIMMIGTVYFRRQIRKASDEYHRVIAQYLAYLNEQLGGMLIVQLFNQQTISRDRFADLNMTQRRVHETIRDNYTIYASMLQFLTTVGLAILLYGGGTGVVAGWATLGMVIAFIDYLRRSFEPILLLAEQYTQIQTALSAGERLAQMLQVMPDIGDPVTPRAIDGIDRGVVFDQVTFGYQPDNAVLRDLSLTIAPGETIAIVGATGAGKTSLVSLLARFYDVDQGAIRIGGVDIREVRLMDLRQLVTVVPQNPYCFYGTIADNLRLFDPTIRHEQMRHAAEIACVDRFIDALPGGYDFPLLPGGSNLSQGQRQLIALARALIHSPSSVLVLDEATSSIDTETEALIQEALTRVMRDRTTIVIAHRLSTVRDADRIIVLDKGRIAEQGTHEALLAHDGLYAQLHRRQFIEDSNDLPEALHS